MTIYALPWQPEIRLNQTEIRLRFRPAWPACRPATISLGDTKRSFARFMDLRSIFCELDLDYTNSLSL